MAGRIATISGTMLVPGVSRNKRLYTRELIARAAARMSERIADPTGLPIVMRSHHDAQDDSVRIVGRLSGVKVGEDGAARYTADLYDTAAGRDIAGLVAPGKDQPPALKSVSIHGYWLGPVKTVTYEGEAVTTSDDLEVNAVDFTATPGVLGATIDAATWVRPGDTAESASGRTPISESMEATVQAVTETAPPIRTKADVRRGVREARDDADRVHVIQRATALGHTALIPGTWKADGSMQETATRYSELREYYPDGPSGQAGFCIDAYNGPMSITMRSCAIDPGDLRAIAAAAMTAAVNALQALDPDMDADIDVTGAPAADTDNDGGKGESTQVAGITEAVPLAVTGEQLLPEHVAVLQETGALDKLQPGEHITAAVVNEALTLNSSPAQGAVTTERKEAAMGEPTTQETAAAPARTLTDTDIATLGAAIGAALKESLAPVLAAVGETTAKPKKTEAAETVAPAPADTTKAERKAEKKALKETLAGLKAEFDTKLTEALTAQRSELREELLRENGLPNRQGYRVHESDRAPDNIEALYDDRTNLLLGSIGLAPQPAK